MVCVTGAVASGERIMGGSGGGESVNEVMLGEGGGASSSKRGGHYRTGRCPATPTPIEQLLLLNGLSD